MVTHTSGGTQTVVFVCPHGAAKSRIAQAWFNSLGIPGWTATSAGVEPQDALGERASMLLSGSPAASFLDLQPPRPLGECASADIVVGIDCDPDIGTVTWQLDHQAFGDAMSAEIRDRVHGLAAALREGRTVDEQSSHAAQQAVTSATPIDGV